MSRKTIRKGGAVKVTDADYRFEIERKEREWINRQNELVETHLALNFKGAELMFIREQIEKMDKQEKDKQEVKCDLIWGKYKIPYPKTILAVEHDVQLHQYRELVGKEKYLESALIREGMTEEQIKELKEKGTIIRLEEADKSKEEPENSDYIR